MPLMQIRLPTVTVKYGNILLACFMLALLVVEAVFANIARIAWRFNGKMANEVESNVDNQVD